MARTAAATAEITALRTWIAAGGMGKAPWLLVLFLYQGGGAKLT